MARSPAQVSPAGPEPITATFLPFVTGVSYFIDLSASSANYASAIIQGVGYAQMIQATKVPTGWSYELVARDSQITEINNALRPTNTNWISNVNLNDFKTTGMFTLSTGLTNYPTGQAWGVLLVIAPRTDNLYQLYEANNRLFMREYRQSTWSAWKEFTTSNA